MATAKSREHALDIDESHTRYGARHCVYVSVFFTTLSDRSIIDPFLAFLTERFSELAASIKHDERRLEVKPACKSTDYEVSKYYSFSRTINI